MTVLAKPSDVSAPPTREAGGDNEVPRTKKGQPRIIVPCWTCEGSGKIPSQKVEGRLNKCQGCGPKKSDPDTAVLKPGQRLKAYTRTTTYIDVLDDKSNLEQWQMRMVLVGVARKPELTNEVGSLYEQQMAAERVLKLLPPSTSKEDREEAEAAVKTPKDAINRKAQIAKQEAGAEDKADKGSELHSLSELKDQDLDLPPGISFEDVLDLDAYTRASEGFKIIHMEKLVVCDELCVAGTPDRVSVWEAGDELIAPDGSVIGGDEMLITDLKTGTVEFGGLKMAMQLALYSRSKLYDHRTGERTEMGKVNQKWGVIMNIPAGTGEGALYWTDLELGWEAVLLAGQVRRMRSVGKKALTLMKSTWA